MIQSREKLDTRQLTDAYRRSRRDFSDTDLTGINPRGYNLPNINISRAILRDANITWLAIETMRGLESAEFERTIVTEKQRDLILLVRGNGERKITYSQIEAMFTLGKKE